MSENWDDLRYLLAVAQSGSLAGASRRLGVSQATVWRHIAALEAELGLKLFAQRRSGYVPTADGELMLRTAETIETELFAAKQMLSGRSPTAAGDVRITAPEFVAAELLAGGLGQLQRDHPGLRVELVSSSPAAEISGRDTDLALRFNKPAQGDFVARQSFAVGFGVYAAPAYIDRHGRPDSVDRLSNHDVIDFDISTGHVAPAKWLRRRRRGSTIALRSNSPHARLTAARAGVGIAMLPCLLADREPGLERLFGPDALGSLSMWLLVDRRIRDHARTKVVAGFVIDALTREEAALAGVNAG